jgi:hypothetical protein
MLAHALSLARQGESAEARAILAKGRGAFPTDKRFLVELAGLEYLQHNLTGAAGLLRAALRIDPADSYAREFLASVELMRGNLEASLVHWNRLNRPVLDSVQVVPEPRLSLTLRQRVVAVSAGQILTVERLRATAANLDRLGIFSAYRFDLAPSADGRFSLTLRLADTFPSPRSWKARLLPFVAALPYRTLLLERDNLAGKGLQLATLWRWDSNKYRASIALAGSWRESVRYRYRLLLDARDERWDLSRTYHSAGPPLYDVRLRRIEAGAEFAIALGARLQWTPGVRVSRASFARGDESQLFADYWSIRARNQLDYELWRSPERRILVETRAWFETGRYFQQTRARFASGAAEANAVWGPFSSDAKGLVRSTMGAGRILGRAPVDQLFTLGMERDNDLWLRGHVGTADGRKGNAPLGRGYALARIGFERSWLRLPFVDLSAGPFFDTGRIGDPSGNLGSRGWMYDTGVQIILSAGRLHWTAVYGRDLRDGRGVFYTAVQRVTRARPAR